MNWMDGVDGKDSLDKNERYCYGLKILFILMCSPRAKDKELKYLDDFINGPDFLWNPLHQCLFQKLQRRFKKLECKTKMRIIFNKLFRRLSLLKWQIQCNAETLWDNFKGIGMKIALLVVQYVYGTMEVSFNSFFENNATISAVAYSYSEILLICFFHNPNSNLCNI